MSSSTSNFNPAIGPEGVAVAASGTESTASQLGINHAEPRRLFANLLLAIILVSLLSMGLVRVFYEYIDANKGGVLGRVHQAQLALERITSEPDDLVMFYGSSMTQAGFSPRKFDKEVNSLNESTSGKNIKSFNFGFGGLNPYFQDLLSRRIAEGFQAKDKRLKLAMIEFNPFQSTKARWQGAASSLDSFVTMLATDKEMLAMALDDVTRGVRLFNIKYVRNQISAEMITSYYGHELFPPERKQVFKEAEAVVKEKRALGKQISEAFEREYPNYQGEQWSYDWQGGGTIPEERSSETLALVKEYSAVAYTDVYMKNDRLSRIRSADIEGLDFEPLLIESFINTVKNFQSISDKVAVIMLPRNSRWIQYSPETQARLDAAVAQIEAATGVKVVDHQQLEGIDDKMFRDTTHLDRYTGDIAYTDILIRDFGRAL
ncbi:hypothetical protein Sden_0581 [Shewanella denitrificans OS217]|uniref:Uncharacterized protein n=1 Tax=Shewanella denitrificans (strain OS217 / ATCC BAA-1090 / DSM 15013) TaxID=318161 RepID=Q12RQ5_SHEDO|nr:hypothetical protein [Shewanella denitrificans]ABE53871.1 hypothetical protein Sden_0581 [Shewanella denitrificans OS217]